MKRLDLRRAELKKAVIVLLSAACLTSAAYAQKKLRVVTTLTDLKSIALAVGGDRVDVTSIATGYQNPHFVDPKPSFIIKLTRADVFVTVGLDLELGWVPPLLNSARNPGIMKGSAGYVDASENIPLLQVPVSISREQGDIHIFGNPHYWLDPQNGKIIARNILNGLVRSQPESSDYFNANFDRFVETLDLKIAQWAAAMAPYRGQRLIAYHNQWPYLETALGFIVLDFLEPKPGIPPSPSQLAKIIGLMKRESVSTLIISPYFRPDSAELVARNVDGSVVTLASSVEAFEEVKTYFDLFDYNVARLTEAFETATH